MMRTPHVLIQIRRRIIRHLLQRIPRQRHRRESIPLRSIVIGRVDEDLNALLILLYSVELILFG